MYRRFKTGCLLGPVLFSMFVNEFTKIIESSGLRGIQLFRDLLEIFILFFADDIALIADTKSGLQRHLSLLSPFCREYKISVHIDKKKMLYLGIVGESDVQKNGLIMLII